MTTHTAEAVYMSQHWSSSYTRAMLHNDGSGAAVLELEQRRKFAQVQIANVNCVVSYFSKFYLMEKKR